VTPVHQARGVMFVCYLVQVALGLMVRALLAIRTPAPACSAPGQTAAPTILDLRRAFLLALVIGFFHEVSQPPPVVTCHGDIVLLHQFSGKVTGHRLLLTFEAAMHCIFDQTSQLSSRLFRQVRKLININYVLNEVDHDNPMSS
jgi:hypothetical protein